MRSRPLLLACCLLVAVSVAAAQERDDAERKLKQVQTELKSVAAERRKLEGQRGEASRTLRQADEQVGGVQRTLRKTQDTLRQRGLVVEDKAQRVANFHGNTMKALAELVAAAGLDHPSQLRPEHIVRRIAGHHINLFSAIYPRLAPNALITGERLPEVYDRYWSLARADTFDRAEALATE